MSSSTWQSSCIIISIAFIPISEQMTSITPFGSFLKVLLLHAAVPQGCQGQCYFSISNIDVCHSQNCCDIPIRVPLADSIGHEGPEISILVDGTNVADLSPWIQGSQLEAGLAISICCIGFNPLSSELIRSDDKADASLLDPTGIYAGRDRGPRDQQDNAHNHHSKPEPICRPEVSPLILKIRSSLEKDSNETGRGRSFLGSLTDEAFISSRIIEAWMQLELIAPVQPHGGSCCVQPQQGTSLSPLTADGQKIQSGDSKLTNQDLDMDGNYLQVCTDPHLAALLPPESVCARKEAPCFSHPSNSFSCLECPARGSFCGTHLPQNSGRATARSTWKRNLVRVALLAWVAGALVLRHMRLVMLGRT